MRQSFTRGGCGVKRLFAALMARRYVALVFADQAIVSGSNFLNGVLLARWLGVQNYGQYVLLYGVLLYANTLTNSLINAPMLTLAPRAATPAQRQEILCGALTLQMALSVGLALLAWTLGTFAAKLVPKWDTGGALLPLVFAVVAFQLQDWLRRYHFVRRAGPSALLIDIMAYGGQMGLLLLLHQQDRLDVGNAYWCLFVPFVLSFVLGSALAYLRPSLHAARLAFRSMWRSSADYLVSTQLQWAGSQGILFLGASKLGAQSAGAVLAAQNIVGPTNIIFQALENLVPVRCAAVFGQHGRAAARHYLMRVLWSAGVPLLLFFVAISVFSRPLMRLVYGPSYEVYAHLIVWAAAYMAVQFLVRLLIYWRRTLDQTRRIALASFASALVSVPAAAILSPLWAELGLMMSLVLGALASLCVLAMPVEQRVP